MSGSDTKAAASAGDLSVGGLRKLRHVAQLLAFLGHAQELYRDADGHPTLEPGKRKARHRLRAQRVGAIIGGTRE